MRLILCLTLLLFCPLAFSTGDWSADKDEDGIRVYTRDVDGWDIKEFKVITVMYVKRYVIFNALMDVANYPSWYPNITASEVTKKISENEIYCYSKIDVPWPSDDRDGESHFKATHNQAEKTTTINMEACSKYKSEQEGYVRMTKGYGFWKLTSKEDYTVVHYQYLSDPGGSLPAWLINTFIVDQPFDTMKALKDKVGG